MAYGPDGLPRCWWGNSADDYRHYHDHEWGRPVHDDHLLFQKVALESFQSGLSWLTILRKRDHFRAAFANFDFEKVARFDEKDVARLLGDAGIIRHRGKIEATINNARRACELVGDYGSLDHFFWQFVPPASERPAHVEKASLPAHSPTSTRLAKELKARGWKFVGPTTAYSLMQACGLVNDHLEGCSFR
ncbi:DNA-3-methyladenine glycosylase I [Roseibacillus ishigakijimensis]|uniref:DNA-3-methyladenine glycosylase I n=1 Tax=Roseibacillus ishigakijimensis TaxID=454146 RepID=A0A934RSP7_9BACT|nr:DNA-3-methyladenine glycosylase I [Roseibacillus ishigakijimensis]